MPQFDAIVVGSGISGGWAAKELTERGLKVLMIERGKHIEHGVDYTGEHKAPWEFPFQSAGDRRLYDRDYPVQKQCGALEEGTRQFFVNDRDHPYQVDKGEFSWIRGYHLGGRSITWGRASFRLGDVNLGESARDGQGIAWPVNYDDIRDWYSHVEKFIGVNGRKEGLDVLPDGDFLPPMEMNCVEKLARENLQKNIAGRLLTSTRSAILTKDHNGRAACHYCGPCHRGCSTGSYFSTLSSTLPAAQATGNLTVRTDCIVAGVEYDETAGRVTGVQTINAKTRATEKFTAKLVFLNASTLGTAHILLNSRSAAFPNGLANSSGVVGRYLMDHIMGPFMQGIFEGMEDRHTLGNRPNGFYIPRFQNLVARDRNYYRGFGFQGISGRAMWSRGMSTSLPALGADLKLALRKPGHWYMMMAGMGECLPYYENGVVLDENKKDKWGLPQLKVSFEWKENEQKMWKDMQEEARITLKAAGAHTVVGGADKMNPGGLTIHEMGTARMGNDPNTSVLNKFNQAHDIPNLFITDGSCMSSSACQNPSLTYMALTARASNYAVDQLQNGTL